MGRLPFRGEVNHLGDEMKKSDFQEPKPKISKGKKLDPVKVLKEAYKEPQKVAEVGGRGFV